MLVEPAKVCGRYQPLDYLRLGPQGIEECIQGLTALFARSELLTTLLWLRLKTRKIRAGSGRSYRVSPSRFSSEGSRAKQSYECEGPLFIQRPFLFVALLSNLSVNRKVNDGVSYQDHPCCKDAQGHGFPVPPKHGYAYCVHSLGDHDEKHPVRELLVRGI